MFPTIPYATKAVRNDGEKISSQTFEAGRKPLPQRAGLDWPGLSTRKVLKNPLDTAYWFYMDEEGLQSNAEQSYEFLRQACEFKPGTLLYIGGVIDYHF